MGTWTIKIQGTGAHHNDKHLPLIHKEVDANQIAKEFIGRLKKAGQQVKSAQFILEEGTDYEKTEDLLE